MTCKYLMIFSKREQVTNINIYRKKKMIHVDLMGSYVSPALACSTISWRRITSNDLGKDPAGISLEVSCILTLCQSANLLSWRSNAQFVLLEHVAFAQIVG